jgi:outer membrane protein assembly factor BamD (BamD/ComL family)
MNKLLAALILVMLSWACSQQSTRPAAVAFHNVNAKYNAIFQADRLLASLTNKVREEKKENFSNPLNILEPIDSSFSQSYSKEIANLIRKATLVIDRHQNSHYLDDSYLLIGRGRLLQHDLNNALETFKYINSIEHDSKTQQSALIELATLYLHQSDYESAQKVFNFIAENPVNASHEQELLLVQAYAFQKQNALAKSIPLLEKAAPRAKTRAERGRLFYILGQMHQVLGQNAAAQKAFEACLKQKSRYDLTLHAQIAILALNDNIPALEKLLKDPKNQDLQSDVFLAIGQIHFQHKDYELARKNWESGGANNPNKGELYFQLGYLFANQLKDYRNAANYFDSAATFLPAQHTQFQTAQKLRKQWGEFAQLDGSIKLQDSLLKLGQRSESDLKAMYEKVQKSKKAKMDSVQQKKTVIPNANLVAFTRRPSSPEQQSFYFYNDQARVRGQQEFGTKWGIRTLEDFWNRKNKQAAAPTDVQITQNVAVETNAISPSATTQDSLQIWLNAIPRTEKQQTEVHKKREKALFDLGKYAKIELMKNDLAEQTLTRLLIDYPFTSSEAEALYLLYLSSEKPKTYRQLLFDKYPNSYFKQAILTLEFGGLTEGKELEAQKNYEKAFAQFKSGDFTACILQADLLLQSYPGSKWEDKIVFLKAQSYGGLKDFDRYKKELKQFEQAYPKSPLIPEVKGLLEKFTQNNR